MEAVAFVGGVGAGGASGGVGEFYGGVFGGTGG